jgi:hypothetical protein
MTIRSTTLALLGFIFLLLPTPALAQRLPCARGATPCEAYASADAVFVGRVTTIAPELVSMEQALSGNYDQTARVAVERVYKGKARQSVVLRQLGQRATYKFIAGTRYLFYAHYVPRLRIWEVRNCGRTIMADHAHDDLRYLGGLPGNAGRTRIAGRVLRFDSDGQHAENTTIEGLAGLRLHIRGAGGEFEALTDAAGVYEVFDAPPGTYYLRPHIPAGLAFYGAIHYGPDPLARAKSLDIELPPRGCSGADVLLTPERNLKKGGSDKIGKAATATAVTASR